MNTYDLAEIWGKCQLKLRESLSDNVYNVYIKPIMPLEITDSYCKVAVKNSFFKTIIQETHADLIESSISSIIGKKITLIIETIDGKETEVYPTSTAQPELFPAKEEPILTPKPATTPTPAKATNNTYDDSNLNPKFVFETFVIGNSNRFAYAAAQAVAADPGNSAKHGYNPLFLYGGVGLGKTHLMHAIGNRIMQNNPSMKVLYTSSEKFTNEIIDSIKNKTTDAFRQKYRNIDCLIIDDIQFLKGKEQTQIEFFHTFNDLHDANKQIIISSDRPPREIETLEDRLRSRFDQGLSADIEPPDLETRIAILRKKAESDNIELPNEVITLLATNIATNIREIEGAYNKIVFYSSIMHMPLNLETAKQVLKDSGNSSDTHIITFDDIIKTTADYFKITENDLRGKKRPQNIAYPRQIAMYLCRELADLSYPKIGELFGRDHTTVLHAYTKIFNSKNSDSTLQHQLKELEEQIRK